MKVEVYWNLHRKCWSVRKGGRVIAHVNCIALDNVKWVVRPAGNAKVRREGKKNVHAFARGEVLDSTTYDYEWTPDARNGAHWVNATYNPYVDDSFVWLQHYDEGTKRHPLRNSSAGLLTCDPVTKRPKVWARLTK